MEHPEPGDVRDGVKEAVRTDRYVYVFIASKTALLVPRRAFQDADGFDIFIRHAHELHRKAPL